MGLQNLLHEPSEIIIGKGSDKCWHSNEPNGCNLSSIPQRAEFNIFPFYTACSIMLFQMGLQNLLHEHSATGPVKGSHKCCPSDNPNSCNCSSIRQRAEFNIFPFYITCIIMLFQWGFRTYCTNRQRLARERVHTSAGTPTSPTVAILAQSDNVQNLIFFPSILHVL